MSEADDELRRLEELAELSKQRPLRMREILEYETKLASLMSKVQVIRRPRHNDDFIPSLSKPDGKGWCDFHEAEAGLCPTTANHCCTCGDTVSPCRCTLESC